MDGPILFIRICFFLFTSFVVCHWPHKCSSRTYLRARLSKPPCRHHSFASDLHICNTSKYILHTKINTHLQYIKIHFWISKSSIFVKSLLFPLTSDEAMQCNVSWICLTEGKKFLHLGTVSEEQSISSHLGNFQGDTWTKSSSKKK